METQVQPLPERLYFGAIVRIPVAFKSHYNFEFEAAEFIEVNSYHEEDDTYYVIRGGGIDSAWVKREELYRNGMVQVYRANMEAHAGRELVWMDLYTCQLQV